MRTKFILISALLVSGALSACAPAPGQPAMLQTQSGRAVVGALAGAAIADNRDENAIAGAAIGAALGGISCGIPGLPACQGI